MILLRTETCESIMTYSKYAHTKIRESRHSKVLYYLRIHVGIDYMLCTVFPMRVVIDYCVDFENTFYIRMSNYL